MLPPIRGFKWLMCELLFRRHAYQQLFVTHSSYSGEDMYVSTCRRCNNLQSDPTWVRSS